MGRTDDTAHIVAEAVCAKPLGCSFDECFHTKGQNNPLCAGCGRCRIAEKTEEQLAYVVSNWTKNTFLKACPGSGKTEVVGLKAAYEISRWRARPGGIAVLTFTNNAAGVILDRATQFARTGSIGGPHFIGTFDSWLHGYVAQPFGHMITGYPGKNGDFGYRLVESTSSAAFLNAFEANCTVGSAGRPKANEFHWDVRSGTFVFASGRHAVDAGRQSVALQDWQEQRLRDAKSKFWHSGFLTYEDAECICHELVRKHHGIATGIVRRFPLVIVDECQDLSYTQLSILEHLLSRGACLHLVGDTNQAIYSFRGSQPEAVSGFANDNDLRVLGLTRNFRSVQPIVDVCSRLVTQDHVQGRSGAQDRPSCLVLEYEKGSIHSVVQRFCDELAAWGIETQRAAVVARGTALVGKLRPSSYSDVFRDSRRFAAAVHLWNCGRADGALDEAIGGAGRFISDKFFHGQSQDSRHHSRPESVSSALAWRVFLRYVLRTIAQDDELQDLHSTWDHWARTVRAKLSTIVTSGVEILADSLTEPFSVRNVDGNSFRVPSNLGTKPVIETLNTARSSTKEEIRITTIHQVKGESLDALLLVSSPNKQGDGGHWKHWLEGPSPDGEHRRFAYVASSRPRYLLAWAVPAITADERRQLEQLGFSCSRDA